ncbi:MAG TPA: hypothetical protein VLE95_01030 [Chlamydiales bacterium]|nr:hypothetical protein [Chlamydiales bacterium]
MRIILDPEEQNFLIEHQVLEDLLQQTAQANKKIVVDISESVAKKIEDLCYERFRVIGPDDLDEKGNPTSAGFCCDKLRNKLHTALSKHQSCHIL